MIYKLQISVRFCESLGVNWTMIDSIQEVTSQEYKNIEDKLVNYEDDLGLVWEQEETILNTNKHVRRAFQKIPNKLLEIDNTPLTKTVYIEVNEIPDMLLTAINSGKARYDI